MTVSEGGKHGESDISALQNVPKIHWRKSQLSTDEALVLPRVPLGLEDFLVMALDITEAVAQLHQKGILHCNISPRYNQVTVSLRNF